MNTKKWRSKRHEPHLAHDNSVANRGIARNFCLGGLKHTTHYLTQHKHETTTTKGGRFPLLQNFRIGFRKSNRSFWSWLGVGGTPLLAMPLAANADKWRCPLQSAADTVQWSSLAVPILSHGQWACTSSTVVMEHIRGDPRSLRALPPCHCGQAAACGPSRSPLGGRRCRPEASLPAALLTSWCCLSRSPEHMQRIHKSTFTQKFNFNSYEHIIRISNNATDCFLTKISGGTSTPTTLV